MTQWMTQELSKIRDLLIAGTAVGAILSVFITYFVTKALMKTLGALVLAGAVVWGVANVDWFKTKVGQETAIAELHRAPQSAATVGSGGHRATATLDGSGRPAVTPGA